MTVKELIEALQICSNQDSEVVYFDSVECEFISFTGVYEDSPTQITLS